MFTVYRYWLKNGNEDDEMETTMKMYPSFEQALSYGKRYTKGIKFLSFEIVNNDGNTLYEQLADGTISDYR